MCGFFSNAWNMTKKGIGTAGRYIKDSYNWTLNNPEKVSAIAGLGASLLSSNPVAGISAYKATSNVINTLKGVPEGNVKSSLERSIPHDTNTMKTNQYRSTNAVSSAADGVVYGQATRPVWRYRNNIPDGITVSAPRVERVATRRRAKKSKKRVKRKDNRK